MKKIITMIGTSLFENYLEKHNDTDFKNYVEHLKNRTAREYSEETNRINFVKQKINKWLQQPNTDKTNASAEIKSLVKLKEELKDTFNIYFLHSDTILGNLAGEILKEKIEKIKILSDAQVSLNTIEGLQVKDRKQFVNGMRSLITQIYRIADGYWGNIIINITGGYKATVPYLSILAQVNKCPIYYIFEGTDTLIKVPYIPLDINWKIFEENERFFMELQKAKIKEIPRGTSFREEIESLTDQADNLISLNPLGIALWEKYKERFDIFYISKDVKEYLDSIYQNKMEICNKSFSELKRRLVENPSDPDLNHGLHGIDLGEFKCFKHKEENLQVRVLYKKEEWQTQYGSTEMDIYIGSIAIGSEVHNAGSNAEYVERFANAIQTIANFNEYKTHRIKKEVYHVS